MAPFFLRCGALILVNYALACNECRDSSNAQRNFSVRWKNRAAKAQARVGAIDITWQQRIGGIVLRDSLPRKPNGKILKREPRAQYVRA